MQEMTPLEAAERLKDLSAELAKQPETWKQMACLIAVSYLHQIAGGEIKEVVNGAWIKNEDKPMHCSHCKTNNPDDTDFCPHCGARMDGDSNA